MGVLRAQLSRGSLTPRPCAVAERASGVVSSGDAAEEVWSYRERPSCSVRLRLNEKSGDVVEGNPSRDHLAAGCALSTSPRLVSRIQV